uniref:Uncharacterized protein n=1 Tax=Peronospora matthiolae TaxID=2874970 RepID=A0AAV1VMN8_9STRA
MVQVLIHAVLMLSILPLVISYKDEKLEESNGTNLNASDYWKHDHPYTYRPHWKRLPEGKIVLLNDSTCSSCAEYRESTENNTSWIPKWMLSTEDGRTLRKDLPRLLLYNLVSPMDYGSSLRSGNVRRRRNKAVRMFLADNLALPLLKSLGQVAWNLIQTHYVDTLEDEMFVQHLKMMNASEMIQELNLSLPVEPIEGMGRNDMYRQNTTQVYKHDGASKRAPLYARYSTAFDPYEGYSDRYYTRDDTLPPPTFPADSYPWLWSPHLELARMISTQLLRSINMNDDTDEELNAEVQLGSCTSKGNGSDTRCRKLSQQAKVSSNDELNVSKLANGSTPNELTRKRFHTDASTVSVDDICALDQIYMQLQEYHFDTGIPRLAIRPNVSHSIFPSLQGFLRTSLEIANASTQSRCSTSYDSSKATTVQSRSLEQRTNDDGNNTGNVTNIYSRSEIYAVLTHFYTYPSADNKIIESYVDEDTHECTMERLCLVYSGVTVYTPTLTSPELLRTFANPSMTPATKTAVRLNMLLEMILVAFEAEKRALQHGLQGPSTVCYSNHDLDVDEFADAVLGTFNMSISAKSSDAETISLHVFEHHMNERVPILDEVVSYYADTNYDTQMYMKVKHTTIMPESLDESELVVLVSSLEKQMKTLDQSIVSYVQTRAANPLYQEVVDATIRSDVYNGSEYTMVGFGFILPATNDQNVLYYDMKLPVPFHLLLRLIVRFQESRLLLPRESRHLLVCLAMAHYDLSFYRCRAPASSDD